ncbi:MAG: methyltransferase domain-containing protein [Pirellulales bacterium]|nr:methyltransferase domain-containing protein [Pirellulales bacterium]
MNAVAQMKTLFHLALSPIRGDTHQQRLESFYGGQAENYDSWRERMLHGRRELVAMLSVPHDGVWVDFGAGTGRNAEYFGSRIQRLKQAYLVDLCPSLLEVASSRVRENNWQNVSVVEADATRYEPPEEQVDLVTFSYSLTMIPDWFLALEQAWRLLRPGGMIGVVDFYVSRKHPAGDRERHGWFTRSCWSGWFAMDNVFLSGDHLPMLANWFEPIAVRESRGKIPFVPWLRAPYYQFVGRKPLDANARTGPPIGV